MGSTIAIVMFEDPQKAGQVLKSVKKFEKDKLVELKDAVVVVKDEQGKVKVSETADFTTGRGATFGGAVGFVIGVVVGGPVGGALLGAAAGALTAKKIDLGISKEKITSVTEEMQNNSSALFLQVVSVKKEGLLKALMKDSGGKLLEVELSDEIEADIDEAISDTVARH